MKQSTANVGVTSGNGQPGRRERLAITPIAGAVRSVLAVSGTLLALMGSGTALAGTCDFSAPDTLSCNGEFFNTAPDGPVVPVVDMTLILGDQEPTSVTPLFGQTGVDATWGGNVGVTSFADISTDGASGMLVFGTTSATLDNQGSIITDVSADGAMALDMFAYGDISLINSGELLAYSAGAYDVTAINAYSSAGDVLIDNLANGTITATAQDGNAIAILSFASGAGAVSNEGTITATSVYGVAIGVLDQAYNGDASVTNSGSITANSTYYQGIAVLASSTNGTASVDNAGFVTAFGGDDLSFGIQASGLLGSDIANSGTITIHSTTGSIIGALASTQEGGASVSNASTGFIFGYTSGTDDLVGMQAESTNGTASVGNAGFIQLITRVGENAAIGMAAYSGTGSTIDNSGYVLAGSYSGGTIAAIAVAQTGDASITNEALGYIRSLGVGFDDEASSTGLIAQSLDGNANVTNEGRIITSSRVGSSTAIRVRAAGGDASADNSGYIRSGTGFYSNVLGISVVSSGGLANVGNSGSIRADNTAILGRPSEDMNDIRAIEAFSYAGTTVTNTGDISASGAWFVRGIVAAATYGDVVVTNAAGAIVNARGLNAYGIFAEADYGDFSVAVDNAGAINVIQAGNCYCNAKQPVGVGIKATSLYANGVQVTNSGSIDVISQHGSYGLWALSYFGAATVANTGTIDLVSSGFGASSTGIDAYAHYTDATVVNSGDITIEINRENTPGFNVDTVRGILGRSGAPHSAIYNGGPRPDGGGDVRLDNAGNITILRAQAAYGMQATSHYQQAVISNSGDIRLVSEGLHSVGTGLFASAFDARYAHDYSYHSPNADAIVDNDGDIWVQAQEGARGVRAFAQFQAGAQITNSGDITALASGGVAYGVQVTSFNNIVLSGGTLVTDDLNVYNTGSIAAINHAGTNEDDFRGGVKAMGILATSFTNNLAVGNTGDIVAEATAGTCDSAAFAYACFSGATVGSAVGILASSGHGHYHGYYSGDVAVINTGTISAFVHSSSSTEMERYGAYYSNGAFAAGILTLGDYGDIASTNNGAITVSIKGEGYTPEGQTLEGWTTTAFGMMGSTYGSLDDEVGEIALTNTGSITVTAEAAYADGTALAVGMGAEHDSFFYSGYYGIFTGISNGEGIITITNAGSIAVAASVTGEGTGAATANGISAVSVATNGAVNIANDSGIQVSASGPGAVYANGVLGSAVSVATVLGEDSIVLAQATGLSGTAIGLSLNGAALTASNAGAIRAEFIGGGDTYGVLIGSPTGDAAFTNSGIINAIDADYAIGVQLDSLIATTLTNSGTIAAFSTPEGGIAVRTGVSADAIANSGTIIGAIVTGDGDDSFGNALGGVWHAFGSSDFGSGDDALNNAGTIHLNDASISLGEPGALGNTFSNSGLITVSGDNLIQMGALNAFAFSNTGTINFQDGAPDDQLTIVGDFGGDGAINLDVSGLHGTSDLLYINGNVVDGSVNTINVNVLDLPSTASSTAIDMVHVSGISHAGNFVLGQVNYDPNQSFLTLDFSLLANIDGSNATNDAFSLGVNATDPPVVEPPVDPPVDPPIDPEDPDVLVLVSGLADSGTLAAAIAPGVQSLLGAQVGTWRQRIGVIDKIVQGGVNLWVRLFQNDGTLNPQHHADNFGQGGNFAYDQKNSGTEIGADFAISDDFSVGLLLAKAEAKQDLTGTGVGSSKLEGDTVGAYATWISPNGFYLDASYRRMDFDAKLRTPSGEIRTSGQANAFNLEAGYAWTLDNGLKIEPQLQYTSVKVDGINELPGALARFQSDGGDSSLARLGVAVRKTFQDGATAWTPYVTLSTVREFDGENGFTISEDFSGHTSVEGTHALVEAGLNVDLGRLSLFGGANWQDGAAQESIVGGQVGMRFAW